MSADGFDAYAKDNGLPPLPLSVVDRDGMAVDVSRSTCSLNLGAIREFSWPITGVPTSIGYAIKRWLIYRIETCSPYTVGRDIQVMSEFSVSTGWPVDSTASREREAVSENLQNSISAFIAAARKRDIDAGTKRLEAYLERLRGWYVWCVSQDIPVFDSKYVEILRAKKAPGRKNGQAVMSWDPEKGPLTRLEELQFRSALLRDTGNLAERVACWLTYGMGLRPMQSLLLLEDDLHVLVAPDGERFYHLDVPRVKQRGVPFRSKLKRRKIGPELGRLLEELKLKNRSVKTPKGCARPLLMRAQPDLRRLSGVARKWAFVEREVYVRNSLDNFVKSHSLVSVRTGKTLKASPRRLRYTFATNKAEMLEPSVLAELLDHSDIRSVLVYYNARESIGEELGRKLGKMTGPGGYRSVTDAFAGIPIKVVSRESTTAERSPSTERFAPPEMIDEDMRELPGLGNCGGNYKCGNAPIVSCYACDEFTAWQEADHRAVVEWLQKEIKSLRQFEGTAEATLADFELALVRAKRIVLAQDASLEGGRDEGEESEEE